ncbi:hypothetical protein AURDEDRAFT_167537 [Auricularia subglabra TFB-10046 SS5]|nr:hypothetical protein AURDEDRAFT_167537 [Auricularia subglabra TFB-10046 SS5]
MPAARLYSPAQRRAKRQQQGPSPVLTFTFDFAFKMRASAVALPFVVLVLCMLQLVAAWPTGAGRFVSRHKVVAGVVDLHMLKTNAERFAFGLPPLPPRRPYGTSRRARRSTVISPDERL